MEVMKPSDFAYFSVERVINEQVDIMILRQCHGELTNIW